MKPPRVYVSRYNWKLKKWVLESTYTLDPLPLERKPVGKETTKISDRKTKTK